MYNISDGPALTTHTGENMQWIFLLLSIIWTSLFGLMFLLLFPTLQESIRKPQVQQVACIAQQKPLQLQPSLPQMIPVPITKDTPPIQIVEKEETPPSLDTLQTTVFEQRLINILVKINATACAECTRDDKKIILQLKMMKAILDGNTKDALKWSEELNQYLRQK